MVSLTSPRLSRLQRHRIREGYRSLLGQLDPTHFLTFNFGRAMRAGDARATVELFWKKVERRALGRNWHRKPRFQRITAVAFAEHLASNLHWHCIAAVPVAFQASELEWTATWSGLSHRGQLDLQDIESREAVARYITKGLETEDHLDLVMVYAPTTPHKKVTR